MNILQSSSIRTLTAAVLVGKPLLNNGQISEGKPGQRKEKNKD
jgi:hypothetical protein